jgi:hypothetical protein
MRSVPLALHRACRTLCRSHCAACSCTRGACPLRTRLRRRAPRKCRSCAALPRFAFGIERARLHSCAALTRPRAAPPCSQAERRVHLRARVCSAAPPVQRGRHTPLPRRIGRALPWRRRGVDVGAADARRRRGGGCRVRRALRSGAGRAVRRARALSGVARHSARPCNGCGCGGGARRRGSGSRPRPWRRVVRNAGAWRPQSCVAAPHY